MLDTKDSEGHPKKAFALKRRTDGGLREGAGAYAVDLLRVNELKPDTIVSASGLTIEEVRALVPELDNLLPSGYPPEYGITLNNGWISDSAV